MPILCPICQKDDQIQKVSSVHDSGTSFANYSGPATSVVYTQGKIGVGRTFVSGTTVSTTTLAKKLSPPTTPKKPSFPFYFYLGLVMFVLGACLLFGQVLPVVLTQNLSRINGLESFILFTLFCVAVPGLFGAGMIVSGNGAKRQEVLSYPERLITFNEDLAVWNREYYCHRDDAIFDPFTGEVWQFRRTG
jgi:hypothetical protein